MIPLITYYEDLKLLLKFVSEKDFDCIVALKRSGWIMGAFLSNQTGLPVFSNTEIKNIPKKFSKVLIVDDKICTGKSIKKVDNKLKKMDKATYSAVLYVEGDIKPDMFIRNLNNNIVKMWYECKQEI